jgi:hypothetical protein
MHEKNKDSEMKKVGANLEQREKAELIAIIKQILRQQPELEWLLTTPLPTPTKRKGPIDPEVYRHQIIAALPPDDRRKRKHNTEGKLAAIKAIADGFARQEDYFAAVTIYEVLVTEVLKHYNAYADEYIAFSVILHGCIDGLDTCFAGEEDNLQMRQRVMKALFAIYRFYTDHSMDLDEDIPGLLVGNATPEERKVIAGWVREALSDAKASKWSTGSHEYGAFLLALEKGSIR